MADEKMKSNQARNSQRAAGGKAMVLDAEQVKLKAIVPKDVVGSFEAAQRPSRHGMP